MVAHHHILELSRKSQLFHVLSRSVISKLQLLGTIVGYAFPKFWDCNLLSLRGHLSMAWRYESDSKIALFG